MACSRCSLLGKCAACMCMRYSYRHCLSRDELRSEGNSEEAHAKPDIVVPYCTNITDKCRSKRNGVDERLMEGLTSCTVLSDREHIKLHLADSRYLLPEESPSRFKTCPDFQRILSNVRRQGVLWSWAMHRSPCLFPVNPHDIYSCLVLG